MGSLFIFIKSTAFSLRIIVKLQMVDE